jgi:hypothetical protein
VARFGVSKVVDLRPIDRVEYASGVVAARYALVAAPLGDA